MAVYGEKKHWWLRNKKIVDKYMKEARNLIASQDPNDVKSALTLLESALSVSPRYELALELKARSLLYLRRFKDVADMLQDYIPSLRLAGEDPGIGSSELSSTHSSRESVKLLNDLPSNDSSFKCFSVSDLKKKVRAGLSKNCNEQGQWRYLVLGQACCHLGLMEDAMVLLQTGKRLATAAFRRQSICLSDDSFILFSSVDGGSPPPSSVVVTSASQPRSLTESESVAHVLSHIKLLLRRRAAALAALDAGLYSESIRHFSKILDSRRGAPQGFLAECFMHRASAYRSAGRIAESIADCNKTLALDPSCLQALETRAALLESVRCFPDSLHDLEHLKLLYNSILRDRKLPGPVWKRHNVRYREIPGKLCVLTSKIQQLKLKIANGEIGNVDYYALMGIRRDCSRSELDRAYLLLNLKHKPERSMSFIDRFELTEDEEELDSVKDRARMSTLLLYRLIQKGYSVVTSNIATEQEAEKQRKAAAATLTETHRSNNIETPIRAAAVAANSNNNNTNVVKGVFCRDLTVVGNLIARAGFNQPIPVKYEALSC
uniref:J domain-containing protein n=1 Tax=Noccaea caerulescens TaxID=107243 RepID=A0A1J3CZE1_NOCCA